MAEPLTHDLFGDPQYAEPSSVPDPDGLPEFTPETLPRHFRTWQQITSAGLDPAGPPVGLLVWTPKAASGSPKTAKVYDMSKAAVPGPREPDLFDMCSEADFPEAIRALADWSPWVPLFQAEPPLLPGVYLARTGPYGPLVYAGRAGERRGKGLRDRLSRYTSGKALTSGLGEAAADRALADPAWLRQRLADVESGQPMRATGWGKAALARAGIHICWTVTGNAEAAATLEKRVLAVQDVDWWNRTRPRDPGRPQAAHATRQGRGHRTDLARPTDA